MLVNPSFNPGTLCLTAGLVGKKLAAASFENIATRDRIPGMACEAGAGVLS